jgi:phospholipase D1/2
MDTANRAREEPGRGPDDDEALTARPLITASEAYPELERLFLGARAEIWAGFRIFDLRTKLRSAEGQAVGATWFDLIIHTLRRGVTIRMVLADFDPLLATALHRGTWRTVRQFSAAREISGRPEALHLLAVRQPARAGMAPRITVWPLILARVARQIKAMTEEPEESRREAHRLSVGLRPWMTTEGGFRARFTPLPNIYPATHHQKLAIFDRTTLYIGGLDLDERRYDDPDHGRPADQTWHDVAVITTGADCVAAAQAHLEAQWGKGPVLPRQTTGNPRFFRTMSRDGSRNPFRLSPKPWIREAEVEHLRLFRAARDLIFIETQYFRHRPLARALARLARRHPRLQLILMLPAAPEEVAFNAKPGLEARFGEYLQARCVRGVKRAFGDRAFIGMPLRPVPSRSEDRDAAHGSDIIYIHAKVAIADDAVGLVGSANLNGRSMRWDTEAGVVLEDGPTVARLRRRLFQHWLPEDAPEEAYALATARETWARIARENVGRAPRDRQGFIVPYDVRAAEEFGSAVPLMPEEIV